MSVNGWHSHRVAIIAKPTYGRLYPPRLRARLSQSSTSILASVRRYLHVDVCTHVRATASSVRIAIVCPKLLRVGINRLDSLFAAARDLNKVKRTRFPESLGLRLTSWNQIRLKVQFR